MCIALVYISSGQKPFISYDKFYQKPRLIMEILKGIRELLIPVQFPIHQLIYTLIYIISKYNIVFFIYLFY
jgi:hypothetical protein